MPPSPTPSGASSPPSPSPTSAPATPTGPPTAREVLDRATVPVLCWHQLRDWESGDSDYSRSVLICPPKNFRAQLDAIAEDGWTTIDADRYCEHLTTGAALPDRSVLLTFDDGTDSQIVEGLEQVRRREMTATFFPMTVVLNKDGWMSDGDVRGLIDAGMVVGAHTWDHHRVDRYRAGDWKKQLEGPRATLEEITGKAVTHMAYPYGAWNAEALPHVRDAGYASAYQLSDKPMDPDLPLQSLRRQMVPSAWGKKEMSAFLAEHAGGSDRF